MKKFLAKTSGRITIAIALVLIIAFVVILSVQSQKSTKEQAPVVADATITIESTEIPQADVPAVEETNEDETEGTEETVAEESKENVDEEEIPAQNQGNDQPETKKNVKNTKTETATTTTVKTSSDQDTAAVQTTTVAANTAQSSSGNEEQSDSQNNSQSTSNNDGNNQNQGGTQTTPSQEAGTMDQYYQESSTVIKTFDVATSPDVLNEAEVSALLAERGFTQYDITFDYLINGEFVDTTTISGDTSAKHPMYKTYFVSDEGEVWIIYVINGEVYANPVSYNFQSVLPAQLLVSESAELTSYNDETNQYYVIVPKESAAIIKVIERIDANTLSQLTCEEIDKL